MKGKNELATTRHVNDKARDHEGMRAQVYLRNKET